MMRKLIIVVMVFIGCIGTGCRIHFINKEAFVQTVVEFPAGEWVPLDGNFQENRDEKTEHFSVFVDKAVLMTFEEFIETYGATLNVIPEEDRPLQIIDLQLNIKNDGDDDGYFMLFDYVLQNDEKNGYLYLNSDLFSISTPTSGGDYNVRIRPYTEYTLHIPYTCRYPLEERYGVLIGDSNYHLVISRLPEKRIIPVIAKSMSLDLLK